MTLKRRALTTAFLFGITWLSLAPGPLRAEPATENRIKAAYLLNFARFVTWPDAAFDNSISPIVLCILGRGAIDEALPTIQYKRVQNRPLVIRHILSLDALPPCHMLYIGESNASLAPGVAAMLENRPILTISSIPGFSRHGGMLTFVTVDNKIRFEVNLAATRHAGLSISSRLLKLARLAPTP